MRAGALYAIAAAGGIAVWVAVAALGGRREAWDSTLYWALGMPALVALAAALAWIEPSRAWRWAVTPFLAQFAWMVATSSDAGLWPLGLAFMLVLSLPAWVATLVVKGLRAPPRSSTSQGGEK